METVSAQLTLALLNAANLKEQLHPVKADRLPSSRLSAIERWRSCSKYRPAPVESPFGK
jgi:hypothetical protein